MSLKIGFIGAGNMAEAMINSILTNGISQKDSLFISDPDKERKEFLSEKYGVEISDSNHELIKNSHVIILSVKPQIMDDVLNETFKTYDFSNEDKKLVISIAAGIKCENIEKTIYGFSGEEKKSLFPVVRVMPNTPALAGQAMSGIAPGKLASKKDIIMTEKIMSSMGKAMVFREDQINSVTAISGSGPAYFFLFIEALTKAGVELGFSEKESFDLVFQTAKGAVALMEQTGEAPGVLREKVTSKGGTTEAALNSFNKDGIEKIVLNAALAAEKRAEELS